MNGRDTASERVLQSALGSESETASAMAQRAMEVESQEPQTDTPCSILPAELPDDECRSLLVHGTFAYLQAWWRPTADSFHAYVKSDVRKNLWDHECTYYWSGKLDKGHRRRALTRPAGVGRSNTALAESMSSWLRAMERMWRYMQSLTD